MTKELPKASAGGMMLLSDANASLPGKLANNNSGTDGTSPGEVRLGIEDCIVLNKQKLPSGINHDVTARWMLQDNHIVHLIETENTLIYRDGVYEDFAEVHLKKTLFDSFECITNSDGRSILSSHDVKEVMDRICMWSLKSINEFRCDKPVFNMANGVLNLETYELMPHSPDWMLMSKSPAKFDPQAKCPNFLKFRDQALESKYHPLIEEFIGYTLWNEYLIHKAFMFLGLPRAGKGTMIRVIESVIGSQDCSHVSLQDLSENRFMRARLFGRKLNTYGDLPTTPIKDTGIFKNLTGEDTIDAENKFEHPFSFKNSTKLLFSANKLPKTKIQDDAFYVRWIIVFFNNSVLGHEDSKLIEKLTTPEELSGIINLALNGLKRLRENVWKFTYDEDPVSIYRRNCEPVIAFLEDRCEVFEGYVVKSDLVKAYNEYAKQNGLPVAPSKKAFGTTMIDQTVIPVETTYPSVNGKQVEAWAGIKLKQ
jgi:putative DNA primase/helicase